MFPAKYFTQKYFAESYASDAGDEEGASKVIYVGERVTTYAGKKYKFYLYKAVFEYKEGNETYLYISGAFNPDGKKVNIEDNISGIYWDEEFSQSAIDKHLKAYIASLEEYVEDEEVE